MNGELTGGGEDVGLRLGGAIRVRRRLLGMTLVEVAGRAGLSHPFLSQLERGLARPSMRSLTAIAATLGTTAQALMAESELPSPSPAAPGTASADLVPGNPVPGNPVPANTVPANTVPTNTRQANTSLVSVIRRIAGGEPPVDSPGGTVRPLVRGERAMLPVEFIGAPREFNEYFRHEGDEFVYVTRGTIEADIEGDRYIASAGDSVYYAGGLLHRWRSVSDEEVRLVVVQENRPPAAHGAD
ncbi:MAG TPA: cupin domain-containing protein [Trebonia sp.]|nr:cupin domain-containing protein [Trebonia sp.]